MTRNVVILGSGPAGLTAAIYAARANLEPLIIEGPQAGGQLTITTDVENFPGFPEGIEGPELILRTRQQAERFGTEFMTGTVTGVDLSKRPFTLDVDGTEVRCKTLIVATGATARLMGLENESRLMGAGVSACATCDGFFFKGKRIMVVGGGDTAMEEALFLTRFASQVTVIHRRDELRASKIMADKALNHPKIDFLWNKVVVDVLGDQAISGVRLKDTTSGDLSDHDTEGLFMAIGHSPNTGVFKGQLDMADTGYLITQPGSTRTNVTGVFAAGDVADPVYRQAVSAAGTGCMAALDAERLLESEEG
ncbi:MAG: thioredoxin-disulfide reductase [Nitrospirota bacterium]|nr:thioredoxin-disulfide reductase [Nitrospirota bacterium]